MELAFLVQQSNTVAVTAHSANNCFGKDRGNAAAFACFQMLVAIQNAGFKPCFHVLHSSQLRRGQSLHGQQFDLQKDLTCFADLCCNIGHSSLIDFQRCDPGGNGQSLSCCFYLCQGFHGNFHSSDQFIHTAEIHGNGIGSGGCNCCIYFCIADDCLVALHFHRRYGNCQQRKQHNQNHQEGDAILRILHSNAFFLSFSGKIPLY